MTTGLRLRLAQGWGNHALMETGMTRYAFTAAALLALTACAAPQSSQPPQCIAGTAGGAALGAVVGNEFGQGRGRELATVAGGVAGALAGQAVTCP